MKIENEVKFTKARPAEDAMEGKLVAQGTQHGKEKARLTTMIMEKDAMLSALMKTY